MRHVILPVCVLLAASGAAVHAADAPIALTEIVVTAQKVQQLAKDVPVSMLVFDQGFFAATHTTTFEDLSRATPGLIVNSSGGNVYSNVYMRGIGSDALNPGLEPSVGVFIDGVYQSRPASLAFDLNEVERIEVLRGPQGALYGKNTDAGAINLISLRPPEQFEANAKVFLGNFASHSVSGSVGGPVGAVRVKLSGYGSEQNGYITNLVPGIDDPNQRRYGFRAKLDWNNDALSLRTNLDYDSHRDSLINYAPLIVGPDLQGSADAFGVGIAPDVYSRKSAANFPNRDHLTQLRASATLDYRLGNGLTLTSITAYQKFDDDNIVDVDYTALDLLDGGETTTQRQFTQELRVASDPAQAFSYLGGIYFYHQKLDDVGFNTVRPDLSLLTGGFFPAGAQDFYATNATTRSYAAFGQVTQRVGNRWTVAAGLRYDDQRNEQFRNQPAGVTIPAVGPLSTSKSESNVSGSASIRYALTPDINAYAAFAQGYKSGGFNGLSVNSPDQLGFDAERARSYEIGIKGSALEHRLDVELVAYYSKLTDLQVSNFNGVNFIVGNAAAAKSRGVEASLSALAAPGLRLDLNAAYNRATYDSYADAPCTPEQAAVAAGGCTQDLAGRPLVYAPQVQYYVAADYEHALPWAELRGSVRLDYAYRGSHYLETSLAQQTRQAGYGLLNLRLAVHGRNDAWTLALIGKNITDKQYLRNAYDYPLFPGSFLGAPGMPRTYGAELSARF